MRQSFCSNAAHVRRLHKLGPSMSSPAFSVSPRVHEWALTCRVAYSHHRTTITSPLSALSSAISSNDEMHILRSTDHWFTTVDTPLWRYCPLQKIPFAICYRTVVCLSVCVSCNVDVLWSNGWMDQDATWCGGRSRHRPHCVRLWPSSSPKKEHSSPQFSAHVYWQFFLLICQACMTNNVNRVMTRTRYRYCMQLYKRSPISATAELL